jgi:hypothetical protein
MRPAPRLEAITPDIRQASNRGGPGRVGPAGLILSPLSLAVVVGTGIAATGCGRCCRRGADCAAGAGQITRQRGPSAPTACGNKDPAFWSRMIASVARPSGALRCGDLLCQFRLTNQGCQSKLTSMDIEKLSVNLSSDDPAIGLRASLALHRLAERVEANHVASAREKGWSWQQIGDALGVTRQSVHTKYNKESS